MYWNALRVLVLMLGLMGPISGWAQQAGTSCTSGQNGYTGSADTGGNITKCNGSTWVAISGPSNTTVTASGTTGSVQYNSGGLLKGDSSLVWNSVSQTLGINTATPLSALDVRGRQTLDDGGNFELMANWYCNASVCDRYLNSGYAGRIEFNNTIGSWYFETVSSGISNTTVPTSAKDMTITTGGLVGIGTTAPAYTLDMIGQQRVQTSGQSYYTVQSGNELFSKNSPLYLNATSTSPTIINANGGNVGIDISNPAYSLDVSGSIQSNASFPLVSNYTGYVYYPAVTPHVAWYKTPGAYEYYWRTSNSGFPDGSDVTLMDLNSSGTLAVHPNGTAPAAWIQGNVGIYTANPNAALDVNGYIAADGTSTITSAPPAVAGNNGWKIGLWSNSYALGIAGYTIALKSGGWVSLFGSNNPANNATGSVPDTNAPINFNVTNGYGLFSGGIGVGTTSPLRQVHIYGAGQATNQPTDSGNTGATLYVQDSAGAPGNGGSILFGAMQGYFASIKSYITNGSNGTNGNLEFALRRNATDTFLTQDFELNQNGNATLAGTLTQNSDARLKRDITVLPDALEKLALIRGVTFNWKDKDRDPHQQVGVIAQDVQKAYPQLVTADASGTLSVNYNGLTAPLIEAVKQLKAENTELRQELNAEQRQATADRALAAQDHQQAALDHDLLMKLRQHVLLRPEQTTSYTEAAWHYGPQPPAQAKR